MTAQPMAPVIPSSGVLASRQRSRPAAARRLPLASPVPVPSLPEDVVYGIARIDSSGRICERAIIAALDWSGGDLLTVTADAGLHHHPGRAAPPLRPGGRRPGSAGRAPGPRQPRRQARDELAAASQVTRLPPRRR